MRHLVLAGLAGLLLAFGWLPMAGAGEGNGPCQNCRAPDGCCYREVVTHRCVLVPDKKPIKKTVYECREVPYCVHRLPKFGHCDCCPECLACPKYKKVLVKREIVVGEICTTKCVVEEVIERLPGPCCHCGQVSTGVKNGADSMVPNEPAPPQPPAVDTTSAWLQPSPVFVAP